jgi:hypothetical protein
MQNEYQADEKIEKVDGPHSHKGGNEHSVGKLFALNYGNEVDGEQYGADNGGKSQVSFTR